MDEKEVGGKRYSTKNRIARKRYGRHPRTISRWQQDPRVGFPPADLVILGRKYWCDETLDNFDQSKRGDEAAAA